MSDEENKYVEKTEYFACDCKFAGHLMVVTLLQENNTKFHWNHNDLTFHIQMNKYLPWYKRLKSGIMYIFGYGGSNHWSETVIQKKDLPSLKAIIEEFEQG